MKTKLKNFLTIAVIAIVMCGGVISASAQTSAGSYWSPAARALRTEIVNRAIIHQATHGRRGRAGQRHRAHHARRHH